jgi:hypothetical protein
VVGRVHERIDFVARYNYSAALATHHPKHPQKALGVQRRYTSQWLVGQEYSGAAHKSYSHLGPPPLSGRQ